MANVWLQIIIESGAVIALLFAAGQLALATRRKENYWLSALLVTIGCWQLYSSLFYRGLLQGDSLYTFIHLPFLFWTGPLLYFYYQSVLTRLMPPTGKTPSPLDHSGVGDTGQGPALFERRLIIQLMPGVMFFLIWLFFVMGPGVESRLAVYRFSQESQTVSSWIDVPWLGTLAAGLSICIYLVLVGMGMRGRLYSRQARLAFFLVVSSLINTVFFVVCIFLASPLVMISNAVVSLQLFGAYIVGIRYSDYLHLAPVEPHRLKYEKSKLTGLPVADLAAQAESFLRAGAYTDENLTVAEVAQELGISVHQLSELFNRVLGVGFKQFLTRIRVDAAREQLVAAQTKTILDIGLAVGFGSRSAFNSAFQRETGFTPSEYRRQHQAK